MVFFLGGRAVGAVKLNTHLRLAVKVKNGWSHASTSLCLHGVETDMFTIYFISLTVRLAGGEYL
jgi:hypothetical protein